MIVQVRNKILRRIGGVNHFVSHNKDYTIQFQFDESWDNVRTKMAVFAYEDGEYGSEIFDGDTCNVPELPKEGRILIGVKAGEDLSTELLCIPVCKSADDVITDEYDEPDPKIYEQILDIINNLWNGGTTVYPSPVRFLAAPSTAKVGDLIRVKEVDENGEIKETEAVDVEKELVVVNITEDADGVLHADMTYDEINPLRYTHAVYAKWASGMYPYSTFARMYFGEDLKNVFVFSSSMAGMENWRIAIAQDGSVKINSYKLELVGRKVQTIDETTGTGDDSEKNYPSAKAVYDALANAKDKDAVKFVEQELTEKQKKQARTNIGAGTSNFSGSYHDLSNKPNIPVATVIDTTLTKSGQAADAKAAGDAIDKKIDAPQVAQVGEVLTVEEVDEDSKPTKWKAAKSGTFVCTFDDGEDGWITCDKTVEEIITANNNGKDVIGHYYGYIYRLSTPLETGGGYGNPIFSNIGFGELSIIQYDNGHFGINSIRLSDIAPEDAPDSYEVPVYIPTKDGMQWQYGRPLLATDYAINKLTDEEKALMQKNLGIDALPSPATAQIGQIVKVKSVDESGKIKETETVDMPNRFDVTVSMGDNGWVVSHKFAEIKAAYDAGRAVQLINTDTFRKYSLMGFFPGNIEGVTYADFRFIDSGGDIWQAEINSNDKIEFVKGSTFVTLYGDVPQNTPKAITYSTANGIGYADFIPYIEIPSTGDELKERLAIVPAYFYVMPNAYAPFVLKNLVNPYTLTRLSYSEPEYGTENNTFEASYLVTDSLGQQIKATCQVLLTESGLGDLVWNFEVRESLIVKSSTEGSSKKFKITVDDSGIISAAEITN
jgi:hypothetical protein